MRCEFDGESRNAIGLVLREIHEQRARLVVRAITPRVERLIKRAIGGRQDSKMAGQRVPTINRLAIVDFFGERAVIHHATH